MNNTLKFWKTFITLQLHHNMQYILENSIKDFHFKGLNYICFQFNEHLTIRLYIISPTNSPVDTSNVNIHNHLYDSQILVLSGQITNNVFKKIAGDQYHHYYLTSALHPDNVEKKIKLQNLGRVNLELEKMIILSPGDTHFQDAEEIHNVLNDVTQLTAFMVFEYPTVKNNSILFSRKDYGDTIPTKDVYNKYTEEEIVDLVSQVLHTL